LINNASNYAGVVLITLSPNHKALPKTAINNYFLFPNTLKNTALFS
jgi:hypothetical protein